MTIGDHALLLVEYPGRQPLRIVISEPTDLGRDCAGLIVMDPAVSRRHLTLSPGPNPGTVEVDDLNSSNGTYFNGNRLVAPTVLHPGEGIGVGEGTITVLDPYALPDAATSQGGRTVIDSGQTATSIDRLAESVENVNVDQMSDGGSRESATLTIVFSDIENSTTLAAAMGDAKWMDVLDRHTRQIESHVAAQRGRIIKNQGDGFMLTFHSARQAIMAAIGLQRELVDDPDIRIRIGMHTGEGLMDRQGDIFGLHVNKAARVGAIADGGQILVSQLVRQITATRGDLEFGEPVQATLKGIPETAVVHEVLWKDSSF